MRKTGRCCVRTQFRLLSGGRPRFPLPSRCGSADQSAHLSRERSQIEADVISLIHDLIHHPIALVWSRHLLLFGDADGWCPGRQFHRQNVDPQRRMDQPPNPFRVSLSPTTNSPVADTLPAAGNLVLS